MNNFTDVINAVAIQYSIILLIILVLFLLKRQDKYINRLKKQLQKQQRDGIK